MDSVLLSFPKQPQRRVPQGDENRPPIQAPKSTTRCNKIKKRHCLDMDEKKKSLTWPFSGPRVHWHEPLGVELPPCPPAERSSHRTRPPTGAGGPDRTEGLLSHSSPLCSLWFPPPLPHSSPAPNRPSGRHAQIPALQTVLPYSHLELGTQPRKFSSWRPRWSETSFLLGHSQAVGS